MWLIIGLIVLGVLLLVAEIILLPGVSVAGIGGFIAFGVAIYLGFTKMGNTAGFLIIGAIILLSVIAIAISVRARTWKRLALNDKIESTSQPLPEQVVQIGQHGVAITRLAPMGTVIIDGRNYEAKSYGDQYVDQRTEVEVVAFENFSVVVKTIEKQK